MREQALHIGGDCDEAGLRAAILVGAIFLRNLQAIQLRQPKIDERHIIGMFSQSAQRLLAIVGDIDLVSALSEDQLQKILRNGAVFSDQHASVAYGRLVRNSVLRLKSRGPLLRTTV